jgi:hypothetical protein
MFGVDMWADARREFHEVVIPKLQEIGKDIGAGGKAGDELCNRIMGHYAMLARSFDPMFFGLLKDDLEKYLVRAAKNV